MSAIVEVRMTPPRECSPNFHGSWRRKADAVAELKGQAITATRIAVLQDPAAFFWIYAAREIVLDIEIAWAKGQRRLDDDNAIGSCKPLRDGIAVALGIDDRKMRQGSLTQTRGEGIVTVTLRDGDVALPKHPAPVGRRGHGEGVEGV